MKPSGKLSERAFTLVELMVVVAIVGVLVAITMGIYGSAKRRGVEFRLKAELAAIELALENYKAKEGHYPYSESWGYEYPPSDWRRKIYFINNAVPIQKGGVPSSPDPEHPDYNATFWRAWDSVDIDLKWKPRVNELYKDLVEDPIEKYKEPFLPDVKKGQIDVRNEKSLLAALPVMRTYQPNDPHPSARWYYNSFNPQYNKNTYDLWVEYGDLGQDLKPYDPSEPESSNNRKDDIVKIISNWDN